jgi:7-carboxy-7-deazaguanine synthase
MAGERAFSEGWVSEIFSSFQGEGLFAGRRHVFLRMAGCNLRCGYCDTPESLDRTAQCAVHGPGDSEQRLTNPCDVGTLAAVLSSFLAAPGVHALAVTGGEPLVQADFLGELLPALRAPVPVLLETNGTHPQRLAAVLPYVDIVSMDVKLPSNSGERALWDEHRAFLRQALGRTVYVKVPVDGATREEEVSEAARLVAGASRDVTVFLQPILSPSGESEVTPERLECFYDLSVAHLRDVRVMPQAHRLLGVR